MSARKILLIFWVPLLMTTLTVAIVTLPEKAKADTAPSEMKYVAAVTVRSIFDNKNDSYDVVFETPEGFLFTVRLFSKVHLPLWEGVRGVIGYHGTKWPTDYVFISFQRR